MKRTRQIWIAVLGWLAGLALATQFYTNFSMWLWVILVVGAIVLLMTVKSSIGYVAIFVLLLCAGLLRGQMSFARQAIPQAQDYIGQKIEVTGIVSATPYWNDDRLFEFFISDVRHKQQKISGLIKVKSLTSGVFEGQTIRVRGKLGRALGRAQAQIWYADVEVISATPPLPLRIKRVMQNGLEQVLSPTASSFASGLLFGGSSQLPDVVQEATKRTGLTHVVAVSGFNLTIITALAMTFLRGRLRLKTILPILALVGFFVLMTGATSSVLRSAIMTALVLIVGTQNKKLSTTIALGVTIVAMTAWNPAYLYKDLSWQLSVLALAGVVFLSPLLMPRTLTRFKLIWELFAVSLSAHLATAPLIAHVFGSFSIVAPLANVIVLPFIPLAMLVSFIASAVGVFPSGISVMVGSLSNYFLLTILDAIKILASMPNASVSVFLAPLATWISFAGLAILMLLGVRRSSKKSYQQV